MRNSTRDALREAVTVLLLAAIIVGLLVAFGPDADQFEPDDWGPWLLMS